MNIERSPELEQLTEEARAAWDRGDAEWFAAHRSAHDPIMLGSAPEEEMHGAQAIGAGTSRELSERESWPFKPTHRRLIDARQCGDVGWTIGESRWEFEDGTYIPVRGVTIFHREDGQWKAVVGLVAPAFSNDLLRPGSPVTQPAEALASA